MGKKNIIGKLFGVSKGTVFNLHKRNLSIRKKDGRPRIISIEKLKIKEYPDLDDIMELIYKKFGYTVLYDTLYRNIKSLCNIKILEVPIMESARAEVPLIVIEKHYADLNKVLETYNIPPGFCFNIDESGFIDLVDIKTKTFIVPIEAPDNIVVGSDRNA